MLTRSVFLIYLSKTSQCSLSPFLTLVVAHRGPGTCVLIPFYKTLQCLSVLGVALVLPCHDEPSMAASTWCSHGVTMSWWALNGCQYLVQPWCYHVMMSPQWLPVLDVAMVLPCPDEPSQWRHCVLTLQMGWTAWTRVTWWYEAAPQPGRTCSTWWTGRVTLDPPTLERWLSGQCSHSHTHWGQDVRGRWFQLHGSVMWYSVLCRA